MQAGAKLIEGADLCKRRQLGLRERRHTMGKLLDAVERLGRTCLLQLGCGRTPQTMDIAQSEPERVAAALFHF